MTGIVRAICISDIRGIQKHAIESARFVHDYGIDGDAHAGNWHRQVSLLSYEKIEEFNKKGADVTDGAFGENLVVEGIDFRSLPVGTILKTNDVILKMTQIGKECHTHCQIYKKMGECIMPTQGVFAQVIKDGIIKIGDSMEVQMPDPDRPYTAAVITLSDAGARGERIDASGPLITDRLKDAGYDVIEQLMISDDKEGIKKELIRLSDQRQVDMIITTGGTGFSPRDNTPEATKEVMTKDAPGIAEAIRSDSMKKISRAMLSRAASVIRGKTLIINLPGSPKAVSESMDTFMDCIDHGLKVLRGEVTNCARS